MYIYVLLREAERTIHMLCEKHIRCRTFFLCTYTKNTHFIEIYVRSASRSRTSRSRVPTDQVRNTNQSGIEICMRSCRECVLIPFFRDEKISKGMYTTGGVERA